MIMFLWDETIERGKKEEQGKEYKRESKENKGVIRELKKKMQDGGRQKVAQEEEQDGEENILRE